MPTSLFCTDLCLESLDWIMGAFDPSPTTVSSTVCTCLLVKHLQTCDGDFPRRHPTARPLVPAPTYGLDPMLRTKGYGLLWEGSCP